MKLAFIILGICLLAAATALTVHDYYRDKEFRRVNLEKWHQIEHEQWYADAANSTTVRFYQDDKPHVFPTECDQSRPIFIYDTIDMSLMGVIPVKGHYFIAERKALPAH